MFPSHTRRTLLQSTAALLATGAAAPLVAAGSRAAFIRRDGTRLTRDGETYRFVGANMWYAAYLGADGPAGDRARLRCELDTLAAMGVTNLRVLASSELSPLRNSVRPTFRDATGTYNETLLAGLDVALAEIGRRGMTAVLYLTNFWEWSGGMMTYLYWVDGGRYIDMNDPAHPWPKFADFTADFYRTPAAVAMYHDYVRAVVSRTNRVTGVRYADDPTIMAWQLSNEPRPGGSDAKGRATFPAFLAWVRGTARLIKSIDRNHLVSTGSEGLKGCLEDPALVVAEHAVPEIDYLTTHVWPLNWQWVDDADLPGTEAAGLAKSRDYVERHVALATQIGKPLVIEEFGYPRDKGYDAGTPTAAKDRFYAAIYAIVERSAATGGPIAGSNFWAWSGAGRSPDPQHRYTPGPAALLGDPPHEPQGWYGVFDTDTTTVAVIAAHARALAKAGRAKTGRAKG